LDRLLRDTDGFEGLGLALKRLHVSDLAVEEAVRLQAAGGTFRNDIVSGPGGRQILLEDPAGNPIELFQPAGQVQVVLPVNKGIVLATRTTNANDLSPNGRVDYMAQLHTGP
jgi:hypothetical protein